MTDHLPASTQITLAQQRRRRHRTGVLRAKIIAGVFAGAFLLGVLNGCMAPGA